MLTSHRWFRSSPPGRSAARMYSPVERTRMSPGNTCAYGTKCVCVYGGVYCVCCCSRRSVHMDEGSACANVITASGCSTRANSGGAAPPNSRIQHEVCCGPVVRSYRRGRNVRSHGGFSWWGYMVGLYDCITI